MMSLKASARYVAAGNVYNLCTATCALSILWRDSWVLKSFKMKHARGKGCETTQVASSQCSVTVKKKKSILNLCCFEGFAQPVTIRLAVF